MARRLRRWDGTISRDSDALPGTAARRKAESRLPVRDALLSFHDVPQNIVYPGKVAFALRFKPGEHSRFETHAHGHFRPDVAQSHHLSQLLIGQMGNVFEVDV